MGSDGTLWQVSTGSGGGASLKAVVVRMDGQVNAQRVFVPLAR
jgi:hypothetical protein